MTRSANVSVVVHRLEEVVPVQEVTKVKRRELVMASPFPVLKAVRLLLLVVIPSVALPTCKSSTTPQHSHLYVSAYILTPSSLLPLLFSTCSHGQTFVPVNLDKIQHWINRGLLDPSRPITAKELYETRCIHSLKDGVKILGEGANHLEIPVNLIVSRASQTAISAIETAGGSVECRYYTPLSLRALVKPHKFAGKILPRPADPIAKKDLGKFHIMPML